MLPITVYSALENIDGPEVVYCRGSSRPMDIIREFCQIKTIPYKSSYQLFTGRNASNLTRLSPNVVASDISLSENYKLFISDASKEGDSLSRTQNPAFNHWWIVLGLCLFLGFVGIIAVSAIVITEKDYDNNYGVVVDAGSSHSKMYVYSWPSAYTDGTGVPQQHYSCSAEGGGISSYLLNPSGAGESLKKCLGNVENNIPAHLLKQTPIYLGATAGMRLLRARDENTSEAILDSIRSTFQTESRLMTSPDHVTIISGATEAVSSWITVNFLLNRLYDKTSPNETVGALDLGGASTQIAYRPEVNHVTNQYFSSTPEPPELITANLYSHNFSVYSQSLLCFGVNEIRRRLYANLAKDANSSVVQNPCSPKGSTVVETHADVFYAPCTSGSEAVQAFGHKIHTKHVRSNYTFSGLSNITQCRAEVFRLFNHSQFCPGFSCSLHGQKLKPSQYMAFSAFYYTAQFLNLTTLRNDSRFTLSEFRQKTEDFCAAPWDEVKDIPWHFPSQLVTYCFDACFIDYLLTTSYGFNDTSWEYLEFNNSVNSNEVGWSLGYMLNLTNSISPVQSEGISLDPWLVALVMVLFSLLLILAIPIARHARRHDAHERNLYTRLNNADNYGALRTV